MATLCGRSQWDELGNASGSRCEVLINPSECDRGLVGLLAEVDSGLALGRNYVLEPPKYVTCSPQGNCHRLELAKNDVQFLHTGTLLRLGDTDTDFPQNFHAV